VGAAVQALVVLRRGRSSVAAEPSSAEH
jgi:hypothetical protein